MGRRTETARQADKLDQAAADAAAFMSANIAKISGQIQVCLEAAETSADEVERTLLLARIGELIDAQVKLGATIAKMRGEIRQRISIHKTPNSTAIAAKSAPDFDAEIRRIARNVAQILGKYPIAGRGAGEGGITVTEYDPKPPDWQSSHPPLQKALEDWRAALQAEEEKKRQSPSASAETG